MMGPSSIIEHLTQGAFAFLRPESAEILRVVPGAETMLPTPQRIFQEDETAEPLVGFPILASQGLGTVMESLQTCLHAELEAQASVFNRQAFDSRLYAQRWENYRSILVRILENVTLASQSRDYATIFWLHHAQIVARFLAQIPKAVLRHDLNLGRDHGDTIKYRVFDKWVDRAVAANQDVAHRLASRLEDDAEALFPSLLTHMRDNVLIFTEEYVSPDLSELSSYFRGRLGIDGRDFRQRFDRLRAWHAHILLTDPLVKSAAEHLLHAEPMADGLLRRTGYLQFLAGHSAYDPAEFLSFEQIDQWSQLLHRLQEFEIFRALTKMIVLLEKEGDDLVCRDRSTNTTWVGGPAVLRLSTTTRPMDFTAPLVVDPVVQRCGLVYDITDFSATLSLLGRSEKSALGDAFRMTTEFQHQVNTLATSFSLQLEKYLGDGAFYSGRHPRRMLAAAILLQRIYPEFVDQGFPFDKGLRLALNFGEYRLLPLADITGMRYEYFGHGLVELSRLSTGKRTHEIDDIKTFLINQGYKEATVAKFFAPLLRRNAEFQDKLHEGRRFYAYINPNGALVNEGIVATEAFVARLGAFPRVYLAREGHLSYIAVDLERSGAPPLRVGLRKLGIGKFKGLDPAPVYEVVDGAHWDPDRFEEIKASPLMGLLERLFAQTVTAKRRGAPP